MTVSELIKVLVEYPPETPVYARGQFHGADDLRQVRVVTVERDVLATKGSAFGPHRMVTGDATPATTSGVMLER